MSIESAFDAAIRDALLDLGDVLEIGGLPDDLALGVERGTLTLDEAKVTLARRSLTAALVTSLSEREKRILCHATGLDRGGRAFRNHYCAGEGHTEWATLQQLVARGLMRISREPDAVAGGDTTFRLTAAGFEALEREGVPA